MAVPASIEQAYRQVEPALLAVSRYVGDTLQLWCAERDYLYRHRVKNIHSLAEKLETGRYERWSEIDDLFACTIVIPTVRHEESVLAFLHGAFERVELRRRNSTVKAPEVFRFDSTRFIGRVSAAAAATLPPEAGTIQFEVQVPTMFEHAWSIVTHDIAYKADDADWRRDRLAAQLKAAVEQIEMIIVGFDTNLDFVSQSNYPEVDAKQDVVATFKGLHEAGSISSELLPPSWRRFADNLYAFVRSYSNRHQAPGRVRQLCESVDEHVRSNDPFSDVHSGSLFQAVLGLVAAGVVPNASLSSHVVVDSPELRDIHGVTSIPRPFLFD